MGKPLKIIQVGAGSWGFSWADKIIRSPQWELSGIVEMDKASLESACSYYNIGKDKAFTTLGEALKAVEADAVLCVVPVQFHKEICIEALQSGKHCLVEKPIALNIKDAKEIIDEAKKQNKKLMVTQNYRFKKCPRTIKNLVAKDTIGEISSVFVNFQKNAIFVNNFRTEIEEPLITDMSIHHFDNMRGMLGLEPVRIIAHSWNPKWSSFKGNATAAILFEMANGAMISYNGSYCSAGWETTWDADWHIQGDGGEIMWSENEVTIKPANIFSTVFMDGAMESRGIMRAQLLDLPCEERLGTLVEFANAIEEDREPETNGEDNIRSLAMVIGSKISTETHQPVLVEDVLNGSVS